MARAAHLGQSQIRVPQGSYYTLMMLHAVDTERKHFCQDLDGKFSRINAT